MESRRKAIVRISFLPPISSLGFSYSRPIQSRNCKLIRASALRCYTNPADTKKRILVSLHRTTLFKLVPVRYSPAGLTSAVFPRSFTCETEFGVGTMTTNGIDSTEQIADGNNSETISAKKRTLEVSQVEPATSEERNEVNKATEEASSSKREKRPTKVSKKDLKNPRHKRGFDEDRDDRNMPPHEGSYANPTQRELFGVANPDENRFEYPEDAKTVKRKVALLLGFIGSRYGGFQVNIGKQTLQAEIELALYKAGLLSSMNFGCPHKYSWSNSARTDKGVHACAQVCSCKVEILESEVEDSFKVVRERLQEYLPGDIQVLDIARTTRNFCSRTQRDRVRYQYMIPSFLLHPNYRQLLINNGIPLEGREDVGRTPLRAEEVERLQSTLKDYRAPTDQLDTLKTALEKYVGTHPFHNFTRGLKVGQPQAQRYIDSFGVQDPIVIKDMEWIPTQVLGDSFLLHQIRKMISLAVDVTRGVASFDFMDKALSQTDVIVSLAPPQGLFLETSYFGGYNRRKASQNPDFPDIDFLADGPTHDRWEAFCNKIREHIVDEEFSQGNFVQYLYQQECLFGHREMYRLKGDTEKEVIE